MLQEVKLEQDKAWKQALLDKAVKAITQEQQKFYYKTLEDFSHQKWFVAMAKILFLIKWKEKLTQHVL